jgi:hypothetical protein
MPPYYEGPLSDVIPEIRPHQVSSAVDPFVVMDFPSSNI